MLRPSAAGAAVVVDYRSDSAGADRVVKEITEAGGRAVAVRADVGRPGDVTALFAAAQDAFGTVNVLVNNAATLVAAHELGPRGIRVNAILPGYSDTEGTRAMGFVGSPAADQVVSGVPLGRLGIPGDYGPLAVFLASDAARFITGAIIHASGGRR